jgi:hypothetical protein
VQAMSVAQINEAAGVEGEKERLTWFWRPFDRVGEAMVANAEITVVGVRGKVQEVEWWWAFIVGLVESVVLANYLQVLTANNGERRVDRLRIAAPQVRELTVWTSMLM